MAFEHRPAGDAHVAVCYASKAAQGFAVAKVCAASRSQFAVPRTQQLGLGDLLEVRVVDRYANCGSHQLGGTKGAQHVWYGKLKHSSSPDVCLAGLAAQPPPPLVQLPTAQVCFGVANPVQGAGRAAGRPCLPPLRHVVLVRSSGSAEAAVTDSAARETSPALQAAAAAAPSLAERSEPLELTVGLASGMEHVGQEEWDACAASGAEINPFVLHSFLHTLERSGSAVRDEGWLPQHMLVRHGHTGELLGCCPLYLKGHSYGEYVFDQRWGLEEEVWGGGLQLVLATRMRGRMRKSDGHAEPRLRGAAQVTVGPRGAAPARPLLDSLPTTPPVLAKSRPSLPFLALDDFPLLGTRPRGPQLLPAFPAVPAAGPMPTTA